MRQLVGRVLLCISQSEFRGDREVFLLYFLKRVSGCNIIDQKDDGSLSEVLWVETEVKLDRALASGILEDELVGLVVALA